MLTLSQLGMKRSASDGTVAPPAIPASSAMDTKRQRTQAQVADPNWTLDKQHADAIINFLIRLACQVVDCTTNPLYT